MVVAQPGLAVNSERFKVCIIVDEEKESGWWWMDRGVAKHTSLLDLLNRPAGGRLICMKIRVAKERGIDFSRKKGSHQEPISLSKQNPPGPFRLPIEVLQHTSETTMLSFGTTPRSGRTVNFSGVKNCQKTLTAVVYPIYVERRMMGAERLFLLKTPLGAFCHHIIRLSPQLIPLKMPFF